MRSFPLEAIEESAPNSASPASESPPLPDSIRQLSQVRAAEAAAFADIVIERLAAGDYAGVLMAAEMLLVHPTLPVSARSTAWHV